MVICVGSQEKGLEDITLIEAYTNLHHVTLGGNNLSDLKPLAKLKDLLTLDVQSNQLTEALDLGGETSNNLSRAILSNNKVQLAALPPSIQPDATSSIPRISVFYSVSDSVSPPDCAARRDCAAHSSVDADLSG